VNYAFKRWQVLTSRPIQYDVVCCSGIFDVHNELLLSVGRRVNARRFVVVDSNVLIHYGDKIARYFRDNQVKAKIVAFDAGETNKSIDTYLSVLHELDNFPLDRRSEPVIAIGGGVLSDVVGFVAGSYRRGLPHVKVPTTLMGYVDASIGIKTGINFNGNKNRVGAFVPPEKVILDSSFFQTLSKRHILNGVGEIIKLAVIKDAALFDTLEADGLSCVKSKFQDPMGQFILERSIEGMLEELEPNLFESVLARSVDFGHTFSIPFEAETALDILHGEAVVIDVVLSSVLAHVRGLLPREHLDRILALVKRMELLPPHVMLDPAVLWEALVERTHHRDGHQRLPLPHAIGQCTFVNNIQSQDLVKACDFVKTWSENYVKVC
jgi:2-epi-5-epi-valiolone synthase